MKNRHHISLAALLLGTLFHLNDAWAMEPQSIPLSVRDEDQVYEKSKKSVIDLVQGILERDESTILKKREMLRYHYLRTKDDLLNFNMAQVVFEELLKTATMDRDVIAVELLKYALKTPGFQPILEPIEDLGLSEIKKELDRIFTSEPLEREGVMVSFAEKYFLTDSQLKNSINTHVIGHFLSKRKKENGERLNSAVICYNQIQQRKNNDQESKKNFLNEVKKIHSEEKTHYERENSIIERVNNWAEITYMDPRNLSQMIKDHHLPNYETEDPTWHKIVKEIVEKVKPAIFLEIKKEKGNYFLEFTQNIKLIEDKTFQITFDEHKGPIKLFFLFQGILEHQLNRNLVFEELRYIFGKFFIPGTYYFNGERLNFEKKITFFFKPSEKKKYKSRLDDQIKKEYFFKYYSQNDSSRSLAAAALLASFHEKTEITYNHFEEIHKENYTKDQRKDLRTRKRTKDGRALRSMTAKKIKRRKNNYGEQSEGGKETL